MGFIDAAQLRCLGKSLYKSGYGQYLLEVPDAQIPESRSAA